MGRKLVLAIVVLAFVFVSRVEAAENVSMTASVNGHQLDGPDPVQLAPNRPITVDLSIENSSSSEITVESVQVGGEVLKLTFFAYEARIDVPVPPGETVERSVVIDLVGLEGQATGHIPARVTLLDEDRKEIVTDRFTVDVRGSFWSVYGIFGLVIAAITVVLLLGVVLRLAMGTLPPNRWSRAARFGIGGIGLGLTIAIGLSATRVLTPHPNSSSSLLIGCGIGLFLLGYLTPTPIIDGDVDDDRGDGTDRHRADIDLRDTAPASSGTAATAFASRPAAAGTSTLARSEPTPDPWSEAAMGTGPGTDEGVVRRGIRNQPLPPPDDT